MSEGSRDLLGMRLSTWLRMGNLGNEDAPLTWNVGLQAEGARSDEIAHRPSVPRKGEKGSEGGGRAGAIW